MNFALDENIDLNAGYRYLNTEGSRDKNVSYQGWLAGVSYRFGGGSDGKAVYSENDIDYSALENKGHKKEESMVTITPAEEETAVPENDYYFISIHFGNDSDTPALTRRRIWMLLSRRQRNRPYFQARRTDRFQRIERVQ